MVRMLGKFCYICGFEYDVDVSDLLGHYCICCDVHYMAGNPDITLIRKYRQKWIDAGYPWAYEEDKPENWDPLEQLANVPDEFK